MIDIASETWATIKKACNEGIEHTRAVIETNGINERDADWARGELSAFRVILSLAEPPLVQPAPDYAKSKNRAGI